MLIANHITTLIKTCEKHGIAYENLDPYSHQVVKVKFRDKEILIGSGNICAFPINAATPTFIVNDKSHTVNILRENGFLTAAGDYFFITNEFRKFRPDGKEQKDALDYATAVDFPVYVKPNNGSRGAFVEKIYSKAELESYIIKYGDRVQCVRIEKPLRGNEWRLFVVDGKVRFGYRRTTPQLEFDGARSIKEHITEKALEQQQYGHKSLELDSPFLTSVLSEYELSLDDIPEKGFKIPFSPAQNLSIGGIVSDYREEFEDTLHNYTDRIRNLFGLRVFGLDVYCDSEDLDPSNLAILEINGNASMESADKYSTTNVVEDIWLYVLNEYEK